VITCQPKEDIERTVKLQQSDRCCARQTSKRLKDHAATGRRQRFSLARTQAMKTRAAF
jgi:hypothetical protein